MNFTTDQIKIAALSFAALPALGAEFEGGRFCGITTLKDGTHAAVVLLANKPDTRLTWSKAKAWAEQLRAQLPTRPVAALLYANAKSQLEAAWHWTVDELQSDTGDEDDASYAWLCYFRYGYQSHDRKSYEGCARAVRLIHLSA